VKRGVIDTLRRAADDAIANWPLMLLRLGETLIFVILAVAAVFVMLVPIAVSLGLSLANLHSPEDLENVAGLLAGKWVLLLWAFLAISVLLLIFMAIHSFVEAGSARILVDAEEQAGPSTEGPRSRYRAFSMERWMAGGVRGWWGVFWIYNLAWGLAGLILLLPLIPTALGMLLFREQPPLLIGTGCIGLALTFVLLIVTAVVTGMWTNRAIVDAALYGTAASESLSRAWKEIRADLGRHIAITAAVIVVAMAGSSFFASFSVFANFGQAMDHHGMFSLITLPLRIVGSLGSTAFSTALTSAYVAAYAALAVEGKR
jgi:hypothetical protein